MSEPGPWHRLFGLTLVDFFRGTPVSVELEKDLWLKQQLLDVVILHRNPGVLTCRLPDGFDDHLGPHPLITFKSFHEALDGWALDELAGHFVNYRKQISPSMNNLLPLTDFRLLAVCVRMTEALSRSPLLVFVQPGVYDARHISGTIRVIAISELPQHENNAFLHLFSAEVDQIRYGTLNYWQRSQETSTLLNQPFDRYGLERKPIVVTPEDLTKILDEMEEDSSKRLPAERPLRGPPDEDRLEGLSPQEVIRLLSAGGRKVLPPAAAAELEELL
jgi:hypothetical protein